MAGSPTTYVALLRGINVGGNTTISMAELKTCFEGLGFQAVKTYINSGNIIFRASQTDPRKLEITIDAAITKHFSLTVAVVVRSLAEMEQLINALPQSWAAPKEERRNVIFLRHTIDSPDIMQGFRPRPDIEEVHYHPGALFWSAKTSDLTKSNMLTINKMGIYKEMTIRGLNTTRKVYDLMCAADATGGL